MRLLILFTWMISAAILAAQPRSIHALEFKGFPASFQEIVKTCKAKGVTLGPAYNPKSLAAVRSVLEKMLEENGQEGIVNVEITDAQPPRSMKITFSVVIP